MRFLQPLEDFSSNFIQTHILGFEVYYRRSTFPRDHRKKTFRLLEKHLLMLRCLKRMKKLDADNPKLHSALMKFLKLSKRMRRRVSDEISDDGNSSSK